MCFGVELCCLPTQILDKGDELSQRVAQLAARCEASCARLETGRAESERLLLEQFGAHLRSTGATPERLPVTVRVRLARRSSSVAYRVTLRPADSCGDAIRTAFATRQRERGDPVLSWGDDVRFVLNRFSPLCQSLENSLKRSYFSSQTYRYDRSET
jgi:hypothetical protein